MAIHNCGNCTSSNLGMVSGNDAKDRKVYLVICWNCGEIGGWKEDPMKAIESWDRSGGGWEGHKGVVDGQ